MRKIPIAILVSGGGTNLQAMIDAIEAGRLDAEIRVVISNNPAAAAIGRCKRHGIRTVVHHHRDFATRDSFEEAIAGTVVENGAELICLAGFMRVLSPHFVARFKWRIINIHPALLPSFPGLHAQRQALLAGAKESGCTVHFVNEGVDAGPIIMQARVDVMPGDTEETLAARILEQEHRIYPAVIQLFAEERIRVVGQRVLIEPAK